MCVYVCVCLCVCVCARTHMCVYLCVTQYNMKSMLSKAKACNTNANREPHMD